MDKLREILVYRFWGLLAVALIVPVVGWWIGSGDAAKAISARKSEITSAYNAVPSGEFVNDKWISGAKQRNAEQQRLIDEAWQELAEGQIQLKTWPPEIVDAMAKLGPEEEIPSNVRIQYYPKAYHREWAEVYLIVNPVRDGKIDPETNMAPTVGIVDFDAMTLPVQDWGDYAPSTEQMREAQEDIWLYRSLLEAIADVNNGVENRADAVITSIESLELINGFVSEPALAQFEGSQTTTPPTPEEIEAFRESASKVDRGSGGRGLMLGRSASEDEEEDMARHGGLKSQGIDGFFRGNSSTPVEEFFTKPSVLATEEVDAYLEAAGTVHGREADEIPDEMKQRYVDDEPQYKSRAFNMVVQMDHIRLPDLLASLSNSPWPIKILRVEQSNDVTRSASKSKGRGGLLNFSREEDDADYFQDRRRQRDRDTPPHHARVEITGTMRIFKPMGDLTAGGQAVDATGETPAGDADSGTPKSEVRPSFRSAELDDPELFRNFTLQLPGNMDSREFDRFERERRRRR